MKRSSVLFIIRKGIFLNHKAEKHTSYNHESEKCNFHNHEAEKHNFYNHEAEKRPFYNQEAEKLTLCPALTSAEYVQRMYSFYW